jgi:hypothetical protein
MNTTRDSVVDTLRSRGEHDRAIQAACVLPRHIDTEKDAGLLRQLDMTVEALESSRDERRASSQPTTAAIGNMTTE